MCVIDSLSFTLSAIVAEKQEYAVSHTFSPLLLREVYLDVSKMMTLMKVDSRSGGQYFIWRFVEDVQH